jgi:signal transduction histidine kinase
VQEALTNIARHAKAQKVEISMQRDSSMFTLHIQDDGLGFDPALMQQRALQGKSIGVLGMQERAMLIGGQLELKSKPGQGCSIRLQCPLRTMETA